MGSERPIDSFTQTGSSKTISSLTSFYEDVQPVIALPSSYFAPKTSHQLTVASCARQERTTEDDWLKNLNELLTKAELHKDDAVSWAAYRASKLSMLCFTPAIISLLPMFTENAHSLAMIEHSMKIIKSAVSHVNPNQVPVIALDQPLFVLGKQIQWTRGKEYNEDNLVFML